MPPRPKKPKPNPYLRDGRLISPPRRTGPELQALKEKQQAKRDKRNAPVPGIITFDQLFTGEYFVKKEEEKKKLVREKRERVRKARLEREKKEEMELQ